jgi:Tfp pilus assembly protein PilV
MQKQAGFSLVEVTLAIGIIAFALVAILGLIPVAENSAREATEDTKTSLIGQDVFVRVRASLNSTASFTNPSTIFPNPSVGPSFYYTNEGVFFSDAVNLSTALSTAKLNGLPLPNYAATVIVGANFANPLPNVNNNYLKPAVVRVGWPLDSNANILGPTVGGVQANAERKTFTFFVRKP